MSSSDSNKMVPGNEEECPIISMNVPLPKEFADKLQLKTVSTRTQIRYRKPEEGKEDSICSPAFKITRSWTAKTRMPPTTEDSKLAISIEEVQTTPLDTTKESLKGQMDVTERFSKIEQDYSEDEDDNSSQGEDIQNTDSDVEEWRVKVIKEGKGSIHEAKSVKQELSNICFDQQGSCKRPPAKNKERKGKKEHDAQVISDQVAYGKDNGTEKWKVLNPYEETDDYPHTEATSHTSSMDQYSPWESVQVHTSKKNVKKEYVRRSEQIEEPKIMETQITSLTQGVDLREKLLRGDNSSSISPDEKGESQKDIDDPSSWDFDHSSEAEDFPTPEEPNSGEKKKSKKKILNSIYRRASVLTNKAKSRLSPPPTEHDDVKESSYSSETSSNSCELGSEYKNLFLDEPPSREPMPLYSIRTSSRTSSKQSIQEHDDENKGSKIQQDEVTEIMVGEPQVSSYEPQVQEAYREGSLFSSGTDTGTLSSSSPRQSQKQGEDAKIYRFLNIEKKLSYIASGSPQTVQRPDPVIKQHRTIEDNISNTESVKYFTGIERVFPDPLTNLEIFFPSSEDIPERNETRVQTTIVSELIDPKGVGDKNFNRFINDHDLDEEMSIDFIKLSNTQLKTNDPRIIRVADVVTVAQIKRVHPEQLQNRLNP